MELALCHLSGVRNFEMAHRLKKKKKKKKRSLALGSSFVVG
jgi:hypothetical protein